MTQTRAIIGLGNPGEQYRHTRHNCGFRFIDALAAQCQLQLKLNPRLKANLVRATVSEVPVWLVEPITYMNRSGTAFQLVTNYYDIDPGNTIVVHDDLDLPAGVVRLKSTGGHGGHNGLSDIISRTGNPDFLRIRIGIGRPNPKLGTIPYVLSTASLHDQKLIDDAISDALDSLPVILRGNLERAMTALHSRPKATDSSPESSLGA